MDKNDGGPAFPYLIQTARGGTELLPANGMTSPGKLESETPETDALTTAPVDPAVNYASAKLTNALNLCASLERRLRAATQPVPVEDASAIDRWRKVMQQWSGHAHYGLTFGDIVDAGSNLRKEVARLQAELAARSEQEGMVMVPREPTEEMQRAGNDAYNATNGREHSAYRPHIYEAYKAMLLAARKEGR